MPTSTITKSIITTLHIEVSADEVKEILRANFLSGPSAIIEFKINSNNLQQVIISEIIETVVDK